MDSIGVNKTPQQAIWDLYVEVCTRVSARVLPDGVGDEGEALDSLYIVFSSCRDCLAYCVDEQVCVPIVKYMEQVARPFLSKWHTKRCSGCFREGADMEKHKRDFRQELAEIRVKGCAFAGELRHFSGFAIDLLEESS